MGAAAAAPFAGLIGQPDIKVKPGMGQQFTSVDDLLQHANAGDVVLTSTPAHTPLTEIASSNPFAHAETVGPVNSRGQFSKLDVAEARGTTDPFEKLIEKATAKESLENPFFGNKVLLRAKKKLSPEEIAASLRDKVEATRLPYSRGVAAENFLRDIYVPKLKIFGQEPIGCPEHICSTVAGLGTKPNEVVPGKNYSQLLPGDFARSDAYEVIGQLTGKNQKATSRAAVLAKNLGFRAALGLGGAGAVYAASEDPRLAAATGVGLLTPTMIRAAAKGRPSHHIPELWKLTYNNPQILKKVLTRSLPLMLAGGGLTYLGADALKKKLKD